MKIRGKGTRGLKVSSILTSYSYNACMKSHHHHQTCVCTVLVHLHDSEPVETHFDGCLSRNKVALNHCHFVCKTWSKHMNTWKHVTYDIRSMYVVLNPMKRIHKTLGNVYRDHCNNCIYDVPTPMHTISHNDDSRDDADSNKIIFQRNVLPGGVWMSPEIETMTMRTKGGTESTTSSRNEVSVWPHPVISRGQCPRQRHASRPSPGRHPRSTVKSVKLSTDGLRWLF